MAEAEKPVENVSDTGKTETTPTEAKAEEKPTSEGFDPSKIADDDFESIFKDSRLFTHPRFKALAEKAKRAEELEKANAEAETKALEEQKKYSELYEKEKTARAELEIRVKMQAINSALIAEASKKGVVDLDAITKLADTSSVEIDKDGNVTGADGAVSKLLEEKPYLVGKEVSKPVGEGTNPSPGQTEAGTKKFKLSQLQDYKFYQENEADIRQAWKLGLIEDDTQQ